MQKTALVLQLKYNYSSFISFINSLSKENYDKKPHGKWSAGEQLAHLVLSVSPLVKALQLDKNIMAEKFGTSAQPMRSYDVILAIYHKKLATGEKAPQRFDPTLQAQENQTKLAEKLTFLVEKLSLEIETFSEEELDQLVLPHPLLGNLSIREMIYHAIYHSTHHQNLATKALESE